MESENNHSSYSTLRVTVYDLKTYYNQAKNMVMNYTEMEAKVREATNDDAWLVI